MHTKLLLLLAFAGVVLSHDILIGSDTEGRKIFDEVRQANPAIWRQIENVTIIAPSDEVISRVVVTDMRPEKDGDVEVVDGGAGEKSVTLELKSPTVLRGYEFHLEVYSVPETKLTDAEEHIPEPTTGTESESENTETTQETDGSGDDDQASDVPAEDDKTTEIPESSTDKDVPALVGRVVDGDILRAARETNDQNSPPSIIANESDSMTTENIKTNMDVSEATTEADMTTKLEEEITPAPESFENSKDIPDYSSLSILDLIKSKEGARRIRHTDDETSESKIDGTTTESIDQSTENVDTSYTTLPADESSASSHNDNDDTIDLLPPVETEYNTGFSSNDENEKPLETSTDLYNRPRAGRGLDVDDLEVPIETSTSAIDVTTSDYENSENGTTEAPLDEQPRNTRDARKDSIYDSGLDASAEPTQGDQTSLCGANGSDKPSNGLKANVIVLNGQELTLTPDANKYQYEIPIVLIIASDTNIPTIKIIAENANNDHESKNLEDIQPLESSLEEIGPVSEEKLNDYPQERDQVAEDDFVPRPVTSLN